jgi:hypothetical protein
MEALNMTNTEKWYPVKVFFAADNLCKAFAFKDEIWGTSPENALVNARQNWTEAEKVELI